MYQNGDVDYLVATDAIGMGLNLDVSHVAFSALSKFDGRRMRPLQPNELAQIAGRAGRYMQPGTFGVTGEAEPLDEPVVDAITSARFTPIKKLQWRNDRLEFGSPDRLVGSLEMRTDHDWLSRARDADDVVALKALRDMDGVAPRVSTPQDVKLLWDVCRIPDFRGISSGEHAAMLEVIYGYLHDKGRVPRDYMARQMARIDRTDGDIDTLSKRLAYIRTWTYVAQRKGWVDDEMHWRGETRAVEDRLSDALHGALTQRFVDRRTSVLLRRLKQKESLVADVNDKGEVTVVGEMIGRLDGFRFRQDQTSSPDEAKMLRQAAVAALAPHFNLRADKFYNAPDTEMDFTEQGGLMWGEMAVGKLVKGSEAYYTQAGYRLGGERAIRIDMLERLADQLRAENSRAGFEAKADMLSITGMTLEQFADLMGGLGYKAEKGERVKVKAVVEDAPAKEAAPEAAAVEVPAEDAAVASASEEPVAEEPKASADADADADSDAGPAPEEMEVFYTFTWGGFANRRPREGGGGGRPQGDARGKGKGRGKPQGQGKGGPRKDKSQSFSARPPKKEKAIDPDNPFAAALMGLKKD